MANTTVFYDNTRNEWRVERDGQTIAYLDLVAAEVLHEAFRRNGYRNDLLAEIDCARRENGTYVFRGKSVTLTSEERAALVDAALDDQQCSMEDGQCDCWRREAYENLCLAIDTIKKEDGVVNG